MFTDVIKMNYANHFYSVELYEKFVFPFFFRMACCLLFINIMLMLIRSTSTKHVWKCYKRNEPAEIIFFYNFSLNKHNIKIIKIIIHI